ncbi:metallophosphoesterase [Actinomadura rugatobispora]|uniref:Metallophosphoesterase n=1 Tax=Actinomadura rugatobispora TaxID=1994 RepID=A0ABW1A6S4_9ACTN|nr:metallophosphoesterase [Actinomadura rugatobispora]
MFIFAQISDLHLDGGEHRAERAERAERVMSHLNALPVALDAILVTGDIADHGTEEEYEQARKVLSSPYPLLTCPGNHDARGPYTRILLGDGTEGPGAADPPPVNRVHRAAGAVFALCDSTIPGHDHGFLTDETLAWLDGELAAEPDVPAFVCFHHAPVPLHAPYVDGIRQFGEERLAAVLARHPQVAAVLCGHAHTAAAATFAGRPLLVAPGVASRLVFPWRHGDLVDHGAPPSVALHVLGEDRRLVTHYRAVV